MDGFAPSEDLTLRVDIVSEIATVADDAARVFSENVTRDVDYQVRMRHAQRYHMNEEDARSLEVGDLDEDLQEALGAANAMRQEARNLLARLKVAEELASFGSVPTPRTAEDVIALSSLLHGMSGLDGEAYEQWLMRIGLGEPEQLHQLAVDVRGWAARVSEIADHLSAYAHGEFPSC